MWDKKVKNQKKNYLSLGKVFVCLSDSYFIKCEVRNEKRKYSDIKKCQNVKSDLTKSLLRLNFNICKCPKTMKELRTDNTKLVRVRSDHNYSIFKIGRQLQCLEGPWKPLNISINKPFKKGCHSILVNNAWLGILKTHMI